MPNIGRIQSTNFQALLTSLGITRNNIPFNLDSQVQPVVLVGGTVSFVAAPTPPYAVTDIFTEGLLTAPVAGTLLADTGQLPVGAYIVEMKFTTGQDSNEVDLQWRNAGNTATLRFLRFFNSPDGPGTTQFLARFNVQNDDERFRLILLSNANVGIVYQGVILAKV